MHALTVDRLEIHALGTDTLPLVIFAFHIEALSIQAFIKLPFVTISVFS